MSESNEPTAPPYEEVNHPTHYNKGWIEHCEIVEDQGWADGYYPAQVFKYLYRAGHKPGVDAQTDLRKASWYLTRWIAWNERGRAIWKIKPVEETVPSGVDRALESP